MACQATVLFADLSGFTALTEALTRTGAEGVEELDRLLNTVFTALIDTIHTHGGDVVRFGGDALTVIFPVDSAGPHRTLDMARRRALASAFAMQNVMRDFQAVQTHAGTFSLRLKIGIAAGKTQMQIVGSPELGLDLVATGSALEKATRLHPEPGQVVTDFGKRRVVKTAPQVRSLPHQKESPSLSAQALAPFISAAVRDRLSAGSSTFLSELRRVAVLFVEFDAGDKLQDYIVTAQALVAQSGGWMNVDVADKGSVLIVLFGAPVSLGDEPARALACALALLKDKRTRRIGVSSGQVFAGTLGSADRQAYTVLGSEMNLAARLMVRARRKTILASGRIRSELAAQFLFGPQKLIPIKGKTERVPAFEMIGEQERSAVRQTPLVGRIAELAQTDVIIKSVLDGHGVLLQISGEAGIGKSRLAETVMQHATEKGLASHIGHCRVDGQAIAYLPWRGIVRGLAGLTVQANHAAIVDSLTKWLQQTNPDLLPRLPLLGDILGVDLPDTDLTHHLDARLRQQSTHALLIDLLRARGNVALVVEDAHWADALSLDLALAVARACTDAAVLIVLVHRPIEEPKPAIWTSYESLSNRTAIVLDELSSEEITALAANKLGVIDLPQALAEWLLTKSHGLPFFVEELLDALRDTQILRIQSGRIEVGGNLEWVSVPDTVQGVVQARIDRLDEATKLTLKVAAVIGRVFRVDTLQSAYPFAIAPDSLDAHLALLDQLDIAPLERPHPERAYRFKHQITHEIAYSTLTFAQRRTLHAAVARWFESTLAANLDSVLPLVAYHCARSNEFEPAARHSLAAANQARARYANQAALQLYAQVFDVLARSQQPASDPPTTAPIDALARARFEIDARLGQADVQFVIGQYDPARAGYELALQAQTLTRAERADVYRRLGRVAEYKAEYARALEDLQHGLAELEQPTGEIAARLYLAGGLVYFRQGEMARAREWCERGIALAADANGQAESAQGYNLLGMIEQRQDQIDQALSHLRVSVKLYHELGDLLGEARASNNLAVALWRQGRWSEAQSFFETAQQLYQKIGDVNGAAAVANNLGEIHLVRGNLTLASETYHQALVAWTQLGHRNGIALAINNLAQVSIRQHNWNQAISDLTHARDLATQLGAQSLLPELYRHLAEAHLGLGQIPQAREFADQAVLLASNLRNRMEEGAAHRVLGCILVQFGELATAEENLNASLNVLEPLGNRYEIALTLEQLARLKSLKGETQAVTPLRERARGIFLELGVLPDKESLP